MIRRQNNFLFMYIPTIFLSLIGIKSYFTLNIVVFGCIATADHFHTYCYNFSKLLIENAYKIIHSPRDYP